MKIDFQIVHSVNHDFKEYLLDILKQIIDDSTIIEYNVEGKPDNLEDWSIFNWIEIKYNYSIKENKNIAGFSLEMEESFSEITEEFGYSLNNDENVEVVFKYFDKAMFEQHKNIIEEIFDLEMRLREILTFVFIDTYKEDYYNLLREINVKFNPSIGTISQTRNILRNTLKTNFSFSYLAIIFILII